MSFSYFLPKNDKEKKEKGILGKSPPSTSPSSQSPQGFSLSGMIKSSYSSLFQKQASVRNNESSSVDSDTTQEGAASQGSPESSRRRSTTVPDEVEASVHDWMKENCKIKDYNRTRLLKNVKVYL